MRKLVAVIISLCVLGVANLYAQTPTVAIANTVGGANATYKNMLTTTFIDVMQGINTINTTTRNDVDSLSALFNINHNSGAIPETYIEAVRNLNNVDYICYSSVNEYNGRLVVEAMLIDCNTGAVLRPQTSVVDRNLTEVQIVASIFAKPLVAE